MNTKQRAFLEHYLQCWNATEAARRAGYKHPNKQGPRMLVNVGIQAAIQARLDELTMSADEVLVRLADQARGSMGDFLRVNPEGEIKVTLDGAPLHLVKKLNLTADGGLQVELYDAQAALKLLGNYHGLFVKRHQLLNLDLSTLTDEQLQRIAAGEDPFEVALSAPRGGGA